MRTAAFLVAAGLPLAVAACATAEPNAFDRADSGGGGLGTDGGPVVEFPDAGPVSTDAGDGCSEAAKLVYVVSAEGDLYSFDPAARKFTKLWTLSCGSSGSPNSMAVDRQANAWINYNDGTIWKLDIATGACTRSAWTKAQSGWLRFGMGFATDGANTRAESLYLNPMNESSSTTNTNGLVKVDLATMAPTKVGRFTGTLAAQSAELTGTGDGRLFGFFTTSPASLAAIDRDTAATAAPQKLGSLSTGSAWAFSFWGGDFWFYTADAGNSKVTRLATADNSLSVVVANTGMTIVGAGVSTCAPLSGGR